MSWLGLIPNQAWYFASLCTLCGTFYLKKDRDFRTTRIHNSLDQIIWKIDALSIKMDLQHILFSKRISEICNNLDASNQKN